jgi:putative flippase GtrA
MGKSRMNISETENRWGNQEWTFQREKTDGKSRIDISEKENRWGNQEWTFQREKTDGEIKNGHLCSFLISPSVFFL